jgi:hypothetical protein
MITRSRYRARDAVQPTIVAVCYKGPVRLFAPCGVLGALAACGGAARAPVEASGAGAEAPDRATNASAVVPAKEIPEAPPAVGSGSGPGGCHTLAEYEARVGELAAADEVRYREALARQGLVPVALPMRTFRVDALAPPPAERVVTVQGRRRLLAGTVGVACGRIGDPFPLARDATRVYFVVRRVRSRWLDVPVCPPTDCDASPAALHGCGAAPAPTAVAYDLPEDLDFGGERTVELVAHVPRAMPSGPSPCPPRPRPPPPP